MSLLIINIGTGTKQCITDSLTLCKKFRGFIFKHENLF